MNVNQQMISTHLQKHSGLNAIEIAEDMARPITEVEADLNALKVQGLAVERYDAEHGYLWSLAVARPLDEMNRLMGLWGEA